VTISGASTEVRHFCEDYDEFAPGPTRERHRAQEVQRFVPPKPRPWLQNLTLIVNDVVGLTLGSFKFGPVRPVIPHDAVQKLRAIPPDAGNVLVGPHPGTHDPFLLYHLYRVAGKVPAAILMASESFYNRGWMKRAMMRSVGVMPVVRGRKNPEAVDYVTERLADGKWCGLFPEGEMYYSREVMPMEYGALRLAVEAAIKVRQRAARLGRRDVGQRPVLVTPFAHVYFFRNHERTLRETKDALTELEQRPEVFGKQQQGDLITRLRSVADRLLEYRAEQYGVPQEVWSGPDRFARADRLKTYVLEQLERRYQGAVAQGYVRRRALKVRMTIYEILGRSTGNVAETEALQLDLQKTRDIVMAVPFSRDYLNKYGDLEMWVEYLRRFRSVLKMPDPDLGSQEAIFRVMPSIDAHPLAAHYESLPSQDARMEFLFDKTDELRKSIQSGVDEICWAHPRSKMTPANDVPAKF